MILVHKSADFLGADFGGLWKTLIFRRFCWRVVCAAEKIRTFVHTLWVRLRSGPDLATKNRLRSEVE